MKENTTYVATTSLLAILNAEGLAYTTQSGFHKVEPVKGRRLYIAATKRCGRIDISGFEVDSSHAQEPHCGPFGAVKQQMLMTGTEEEIGQRFVELVRVLKTLAPVEPKPKAAPKAKAPKAPKAEKVATTGETPDLTAKVLAEQKAKRMALIARVAAEKKVAISANASAE